MAAAAAAATAAAAAVFEFTGRVTPLEFGGCWLRAANGDGVGIADVGGATGSKILRLASNSACCAAAAAAVAAAAA